MTTATWKSWARPRLQVVLVFALLYLFLVSIKLMGTGFETLGRGFANLLERTVANPVVGLALGVLVTSLVHSSSTVTSIVVGLVAAGQLSVAEAVPVIMGANIGTTVTNMLVSVVHVSHKPEFRRAVSTATLHDFFNILTVAILFPVELLTGYLARTAGLVTQLLVGIKTGRMPSPLSVVIDPGVRLLQGWVADLLRAAAWGREVQGRVLGLALVGVAVLLLFSSLLLLVKSLRSLLAERMEGVLDRYLFTTTGRSLLVGLVLTMLVQSSGVTTSLLVPLGAAGLLTLERAFPYTMGTNIGTTVTAILASLATDSPEALTIALVHTVFNVTGVTLMLTIRPLGRLPIYLARKMGDAVMRNRAIVLAYILLVFYLIPGVLVFLSRWLSR